MPNPSDEFPDLIPAWKEAWLKACRENHTPLRSVMVDSLEDWALGVAIREGLQTKLVGRENVFEQLRATPH